MEDSTGLSARIDAEHLAAKSLTPEQRAQCREASSRIDEANAAVRYQARQKITHVVRKHVALNHRRARAAKLLNARAVSPRSPRRSPRAARRVRRAASARSSGPREPDPLGPAATPRGGQR